MNHLLESLEWRYAVKLFDPTRTISDDIWDSLEQALVLTPSSYGLQPWKFLVVRDNAIREKLRAASWNQKQVTDCSHFVVMAQKIEISEAYIDEYLQDMASKRNIPVDQLAGFRNGMIADLMNGQRSKIIPEWAARQAYIALGNFMTAAAVLKVDTCPMEGLDPKKYDDILGLTNTEYRTIVACAAGYRNPDDKLAKLAKVRFSRQKMVTRI